MKEKQDGGKGRSRGGPEKAQEKKTKGEKQSIHWKRSYGKIQAYDRTLVKEESVNMFFEFSRRN